MKKKTEFCDSCTKEFPLDELTLRPDDSGYWCADCYEDDIEFTTAEIIANEIYSDDSYKEASVQSFYNNLSPHEQSIVSQFLNRLCGWEWDTIQEKRNDD